MNRRGPQGSMAMALAVSIFALGAAAGLVAVVRAMRPSEPTPPPLPAPTPTPTSQVAAKDTTPIAFRDPDNTKRWIALRPKVDAARTAIAAFDKATTIPADDLEAACTDIFRDANPLAGEGHSEVRSYADGAKRLCDYDRSLALIALVVRVQKASPPKSKDEKRARCDFAAKSAKRLTERGYSDDEKAKTALADIGKACL